MKGSLRCGTHFDTWCGFWSRDAGGGPGFWLPNTTAYSRSAARTIWLKSWCEDPEEPKQRKAAMQKIRRAGGRVVRANFQALEEGPE